MTKRLVSYSSAFLCSLIITWSLGLLFVIYKHYIESPWIIWFYGILNVFLATGIFYTLLFPFFYITKEHKVIRILTHILFCGVLLIEIISLFYFTVTLNLLDKTVFQFDNEQLTLIFNNYFVFKWYYLLLPFPIALYYFFLKILRFKNAKPVSYTFLGLGFLSIFLGFQVTKNGVSYALISKNKTIYFFQSVIDYAQPKYISLTEEDVRFYQQSINLNLENSDYPLYHATDTSNTLSPFFELKETPPNIVFIIVESLSASFSGPNADEISYTPFLDSLAEHSLYFENFLATAERSFAALPSILGSLPHGESGFTNKKLGYPNNETLPTWLFKNGYTGDFHYGGYGRFDNMDLFMDNQGFAHIYDRKEYNYEGTGLKTSIDSIPFGVPDKHFFKSILDVNNQRKSNVPFLDVYFTLSMHYPYMIEDHDNYYRKVKSIIQTADVDEKIKSKHKKYIAEFATFLYADDALKWYFSEQKKNKEYQNTIYVIIGDHMMGEITQSSQIEKYRTVLMIYSPLLKKTKNIKGTNSHLDMAPAFYNLLQQDYNFPALDSTSWLGHPIDTSSVFQSNRDILFMYNSRGIEDILRGTYYLSKDNLYTIGDRLQLTQIEDQEKKRELEKLRTISTAVHKEVVTRNLLIPYKFELEQILHTSKKLHINKETEYVNVQDIVLPKPYKEILFDLTIQLSGDWKPDKNDEENPILVYTANRGDSVLFWNYLDLQLDEKEINSERRLNFLVSNNLDFKLKKGDIINIYFWNKSMSEKSFDVSIPSLVIKGREK